MHSGVEEDRGQRRSIFRFQKISYDLKLSIRF